MKMLANRKTGIITLLFLTVFAIFWPVLAGQKVLVGKWTLFDQYPRLAFISRSLANGESVIWTDNFLSGFPIYLGVWGEHIQPITLGLFRFFDYVVVSHWLIFFNTFLSGVFIYVLARNLSISKTAALIVPLVYMFNQWNLFYGSMHIWNNVYPLIPLLFLSVLKISRGKIWYLAPAISAMAIGWLSVMTDVILYVTIALFFFALFLDWPIFIKRDGRTGQFRSVKYCLIIFTVGIALAVPKIIPTYNFVEFSTRAEGVSNAVGFLESANNNGYLGVNSLISLFYPYFSLPYADFIPLFNGADKLTFLYFGIMPLILAVLFFVVAGRIFRQNRLAKYFCFLFVITFLMLIKYIPLFWLVHKLPVFNLFGGTGKYTFLTFFSLALLCGYALDEIERLKDAAIFKKFVKWTTGLTTFVFTTCLIVSFTLVIFKTRILALANGYFERNLYQQSTTLRPLEHYYDLITKTYDHVAGRLSLADFHFVVTLVFIALPVFLLRKYQYGKMNGEQFKKIAVAIAAFNFLILWQGFFDLVPERVIRDIPTSVVFIQEKQKENELTKPFRTFRFWGGLSQYVEMGLDDRNLEDKSWLEIAMLAPNYSLLHNINFVGGHENIMSARLSRIMALIGSERAPGNTTWIFDQNLPLPAKLSRFQSVENRRLLSMMNVKYLLTSFGFNPPLKKVFETKITSANIPVYVYENPDVLPRVYFANNVKFIESNQDFAFQELLAVKDFKKTTLIECANPQCLYAQYQADPNDTLTIKEIKSGYLKLATYTKYPRWLIYSESNLPTWEATLTQSTKLKVKNRIPIYTANYLYQAVYLPPGENEVVFEYPGIKKQMLYSLTSIIGF